MAELLEEIQRYWSTRTEGYSQVNYKELLGMQRGNWLAVLKEHFPGKAKEELKILDVGTGPGFFPIILAEDGYQVTAVDYTPEMLEKARENLKENAGDCMHRVSFCRMDAQNLEFEDHCFDVVISRNLTWNLENPALAYQEWYRVLKNHGVLMNFDANWYGYLYDEEKRIAYEQDRERVAESKLDDHYLGTDIDAMEQIALQVPMSKTKRPLWDVQILTQIGFGEVKTDMDIWKRVWSEEEKINYGSTPMFMVYAKKK